VLDHDVAVGETVLIVHEGRPFQLVANEPWSAGKVLTLTVPGWTAAELANRGLGWRAEVIEHLRKGSPGVVCVTELMNHVIDQGNEKFKGTKYEHNWLIYHDHLSQWWEKGAQAHLESRGFKDRQIRCLGDTNKGTRYEGNLCGNSYELMPLDNNLFSDLKDTNKQNVIATANLALDDERRFKIGTPSELSSSLRRTWEYAPTPERIVQDIKRWPLAVKSIIEHKGALVPTMRKRSGRRALRKGATVRVLHPQAQEALEERFKKWDAAQ